jgi:DNA-binding NarL/FixJ family response regulator
MKSTMRSVFLVDDHDIVQYGLTSLIRGSGELDVVGTAGSVAQAKSEIARLVPDLVITDLSLPDSKGLDTVRAMVGAQAGRPLLVLSMHDEYLYAEQAIALGAKGYLMKEKAQENVVSACLTVLDGGIWVSPAVNTHILQRMQPSHHTAPNDPGTTKLTAREVEVMQMLGVGKTTKELARELGISNRTVDLHRASIKSKLSFKSGAEMIAFAASHVW